MMKLIPQPYRATVVLVLIGALCAGGFFAVKAVRSHFAEMTELRDYKEKAEAVSKGTEGAAEAIDRKTTDVSKVEVVISDRRASAEQQFKDLKDENEDVRSWANGVIPVELRNAERARRAALNRSPDDPVGSEATGPAAHR